MPLRVTDPAVLAQQMAWAEFAAVLRERGPLAAAAEGSCVAGNAVTEVPPGTVIVTLSNESEPVPTTGGVGYSYTYTMVEPPAPYAQRVTSLPQAWATFYRLLTREQAHQWYDHGWVDVKSSHRRDYRFLYMANGNIIRHGDMMRFCIESRSPYTLLPVKLACQWYLLTHAEEVFLTQANALGPVASFPRPSQCSCFTCRSEWPIPPAE